MLKNLARKIIGEPAPTTTHSLDSLPDLNFTLSQLAINERHSSLEALPDVSNYTNQKSYIAFDGVYLKHTLNQYLENDKLPLPNTADREQYYGDRHYDYWLSGLKDYLRIKQTLAKHNTSTDPLFAKVLDFGCASGRVLRHFLCHEPDIKIWGTDINVKHIDWILQFLGQKPLVFQNTI